MKKRTLITLAVLIIISLLILFSLDRSPFGKKNTSLAVPEDKEITMIELSGNDGNLVLGKKGNEWLLNGDKETRRSSINFIIRILREMSIKSPVSTDMFNKEIRNEGISPVRVRAYDNHRVICDFLVYKTRSNIYGNIMKKSRMSKPFIFYVPGHDTDIGSAFTLNELYWQPYTIFNLMPSEIKEVRFENVSDSANSFDIRNSAGKCILTDGRKEIKCDSSLVKRYLSYFTFIPFESWAAEMKNEEKSRIISSTPLYRLKVFSVAGKVVDLTLWERTDENGEKDSNRLYGMTGNSGEIFIVRYFDIDPVLKRREFFNNN